MKNLLILVIFTACASPDYDYQEQRLNEVSAEMETSLVDFRNAVEDLRQSVCREHWDYKKTYCNERIIDDELQRKICDEYKNEPEYCLVYKK